MFTHFHQNDWLNEISFVSQRCSYCWCSVALYFIRWCKTDNDQYSWKENALKAKKKYFLPFFSHQLMKKTVIVSEYHRSNSLTQLHTIFASILMRKNINNNVYSTNSFVKLVSENKLLTFRGKSIENLIWCTKECFQSRCLLYDGLKHQL